MSRTAIAPQPGPVPRGGRDAPSGLDDIAARLRVARLVVIALAVGIATTACGGSTPTASPGASTSVAVPSSASASVASSPSGSSAASGGTATACTADSVAATAGPWGGAAGSRGTDVTLVNRGATPCVLPAMPRVALLDAGGNVLAESLPGQGTTGPSLAPNGTAVFSLVVGNWCNRSASLPIHFRLALAASAIDIGALSLARADDLPPCNGPGEPVSMSTTDWQAR